MATGNHRDPQTGEWTPITYAGSGTSQPSTSAPVPRYKGDIWVDTDDTVLSWDTTWQYPPLLNGWMNYPAAQFGQVRYRKYPGGLVLMEGLARGPASGAQGSAIFNLPAGYRPISTVIWNSQCAYPYVAHMYTYPDGNVVAAGVASGGNLSDWLVLNGTHVGVQ